MFSLKWAVVIVPYDTIVSTHYFKFTAEWKMNDLKKAGVRPSNMAVLRLYN